MYVLLVTYYMCFKLHAYMAVDIIMVRRFIYLCYYIIVVTCALVIYLICTPSSLGPVALGNSSVQNTCIHVTTIKYNTLTPQIIGKCSATNLMMLPSPHIKLHTNANCFSSPQYNPTSLCIKEMQKYVTTYR